MWLYQIINKSAAAQRSHCDRGSGLIRNESTWYELGGGSATGYWYWVKAAIITWEELRSLRALSHCGFWGIYYPWYFLLTFNVTFEDFFLVLELKTDEACGSCESGRVSQPELASSPLFGTVFHRLRCWHHTCLCQYWCCIYLLWYKPMRFRLNSNSNSKIIFGVFIYIF